MSAVPRPARGASLLPDDAVRRYVEVVRRDIEPDPLFRRRLRGAVVNRFVAEREGVAIAVPGQTGRQMGRLGRACLYASFAVALSVGGVMAASEAAIPGDFLYPLKRSIEEMRMEFAPAHLSDDLAAYELGERLDEIGRLVERGAYETAAALAQRVEASYGELVTTFGADALAVDQFDAQLAHLGDVLGDAPDGARDAIVSAMDDAPGLRLAQGHSEGGPGSKSRDQGSGGSGENGASNGDRANGGAGAGTGDGSSGESGASGDSGNGPSGPGTPGQADGTPRPEPTDESEASERAERTPRPDRSPKPPAPHEPTEDAEGDGS